MSDTELSVIIKQLSEQNVNSGYRKIKSLLRTVDPIDRRSYIVPPANYLWHLDAHHKLIRWNFSMGVSMATRG